MIKRWKRRAKLLATSIVIAGYVTIGLYNIAVLRGAKSKKGDDGEAAVPSTVKTIVGYSLEFRIREEMMTEEIDCKSGPPPPPEDTSSEWKRDENRQLYVFSAYYDVRLEPYHYIRVIGLLPRNTSFYCQVRTAQTCLNSTAAMPVRNDCLLRRSIAFPLQDNNSRFCTSNAVIHTFTPV